MEYTFYDKKENKREGVIENHEKFQAIIQKLKSMKELNAQENNQILYEVSRQVPSLVYHRVEKLTSNSLFSTELEQYISKKRISFRQV